MSFRSSEYLQRCELVRFQLDDVIRIPAVGQNQNKSGYKLTINDRSSFYDWYNAYFEVQFQLQKTGPRQSMKIDDRKTNRSIDDNRLIIVNWHRLASANR